MEHVCKLSGPQRDLQLPPETVAYLLPCLRQGCSQGVFFYRCTAMAEFQHVNCMIGSQESARAETFTEVVASMVATPLQGINFHACSLARHKFPRMFPCKA